jgi:mRNA-degrading endonuclease RelE of RelBE toxin-antitoxin system
MTTKPPVEIIFLPYFLKALKHLRKKYPHISSDLKTLINRLEQAETPGDQIQGTKYTTYKVRVQNTDAKRGKSGGYRVIYYIKTSERVFLLTIYSKTEQADISTDEIRRIIKEFESE